MTGPYDEDEKREWDDEDSLTSEEDVGYTWDEEIEWGEEEITFFGRPV